MKIIRGGRRSGKTTSALAWMLGDEKRILIVPTATRPFVVGLLRDMIGKTDPRIERRIFGAGEIANGDRIRGMAAGQVGIDELGWVLCEILRPSVTFATINDYHSPIPEGEDDDPFF